MGDVERIRVRLRESAKAHPEVRDLTARRHRYRLDPPLPASEVAAFERRHGLELRGSFARLVVTGGAAGQVWSDHLWTGSSLDPGPDFRDWYLRWLDGAAGR
ncbi:hypothetical protein [Streptomyces sp. Y1]|uniref:SMI1/KNR4 family protein n=1 Tax=Streptomyces sp. Y1 TaxID=3238634 RepID=A0AB39TRG4_9ACTN